jgi:hypothetical protein
MTFDVSFRKQKMQVKSETPLPGSPAVIPELVRYSQLVNNWLLTTRLTQINGARELEFLSAVVLRSKRGVD